jgi:hypothetical protein
MLLLDCSKDVVGVATGGPAALASQERFVANCRAGEPDPNADEGERRLKA